MGKPWRRTGRSSYSESKLPKIALGASKLLEARQQVCGVSRVAENNWAGFLDITHTQTTEGRENSR
ncbi:hypothetical protein E2C01_043942 [Portunus trituberculatus]|uniref:Uncharacterized protein n=1 Tax=Portunus trituberculatus TaxID=210409 RepID=A0A5B7FQR6_PORTR|nr:hypothetical protein [Portunus trituberculatus]